MGSTTQDGQPIRHPSSDLRPEPDSPPVPDGDAGWRFMTNHARVLETIANDPATRQRDIARIVGITERTAGQIVDDLVRAGYVTKTRDGRRNRYEVHDDLPLRHPQHRHRTVGELIAFLRTGEPDEERRR